jgi:ABC-2 type transport system permease protein
MIASTLAVLGKETRELLRDPFMLGISFLMPIVLLVLFGYGLNLDVDHIPTAVVDQDASPQSVDYVQRFQQSGYFDIVAAPRRFDEAQRLMSTDRVKAIIVIPPDFARHMSESLPAPIQVVVDGSFPPTATVALGYAQALGAMTSYERIAATFASHGTPFAPPIDVETRALYNPELRTKNFVVSGLLAVILLAFPPLLSSLSIVRERERGSLTQLQISPVGAAAFVIGKTIPYTIIGFLELLIIMIFGITWFQVPFVGSPLLFSFAALVYVGAAVGIGILVSTITKSQVVAMLVSLIATLMPSVLFSGFIFPIFNMPKLFQWYTYLFPARYFIELSRGMWLKGNTFAELWAPMALLTLYASAVLATAIWRARSLIRR